MLDGFAYNLRHLRALSAIAEQGSMSAAAGAIGLSQPALAQGLAKLEQQFDARLFERVQDGMRPTPAGRVVLDRVSAALARIANGFRTLPRFSRRGFQRPENLVTSTQIKALISLAEGGSFMGASRATGTSQPALHRAVRELEAICALPLAERRGQRVVLTEHGGKLARAFRLANAELVAARQDLAGDLGEGQIAIGAMPLCRALLLPSAISRMIRVTPSLRFDIAEGSYGELIEPLREGRIDIMIGALRDPSPPDLDQQYLFTDRLAIAARKGHPLAGSAKVSLDELGGYPWIIGRQGSPLRAHWEEMFDSRVRPEAPIECGSVMTIRGILLDSNSLTLLSPDQIALELRAGLLTILRADLPAPERQIGVISRAGWRPTRLQRAFVETLRQSACDSKVPEIE
jgi:LysR family transcriptional regulator, regulator for genes of the gallate degradation pathway